MSREWVGSHIDALVAEWQQRLDLPGVSIYNVFVDSTIDDDETAAITDCKWAYRQAEIRWSLTVCASMGHDELEGVVVHELAHVLLGVLDDRLKAGSDDHCEYATENVARALLAVRDATRGDL